MKIQMFGLFIGLILLSAFSAACAPTPTSAPIPPPPTATPIPPTIAPTQVPPTATLIPPPAYTFPKGATWTYEGLVKWDEKSKAQQKTLTWKMQIADKIERADGIVGYVMKGHLLDLAFYDATKKPSDYLYIAKANRVYQVTLMDDKPIARVKDKNDGLADLMNDETLVLDLPLAANKKFGPAQFVANPSAMNVWVVTEAKPTKLAGIKGITPTDSTEYTLNYKTNPDRQDVYFVPNFGITRMVYHHNGTLSDFDVKLIEYAINTKP
jgi:hypothetical protein